MRSTGTGTSPCGVVQSNKVKQIGRAQKVSDHFVFVRDFMFEAAMGGWGVKFFFSENVTGHFFWH